MPPAFSCLGSDFLGEPLRYFLLADASLEQIEVVDISREILEMSELVFPDPADPPLRDPRVPGSQQ